MSKEDEIKKFSEILRQQRDEIKAKLHLGRMQAKEEMNNAENVLESFLEKVDRIADKTKETAFELISAAQNIGDELKESYGNLVQHLQRGLIQFRSA